MCHEILVDFTVFHDDQKILGGIFDQLDVLQWMAVDKQEIG